MSAQRPSRHPEWDELDAIVGAELDLVLARRPRPAVEPEVDERLFLEQAAAFLAKHPEPERLIEALRQRAIPAVVSEAPPPAQDDPAIGHEQGSGEEEMPS
ncbi:hypothetical protein [Sphingomonas sp. ERG5]|uniref:hypothetical protein n=1 Tax=Sphingomonas sp. ERG5 TaxID=1381597 RepID=UPI00054B3A0C|nr:hypothetical protein [Sphingomonas sp. ERG5]